jgi:uncharacterized membrane protein (DUF485 family)
MAEAVRSTASKNVDAHRSAQEVLASPEFAAIVKKRWTVSMTLLVLLFGTYYGYILLVATNKELVAQKIGEVTTLATPIGIAVILFAWLLTAIYVGWANKTYDPEVERLKGQLKP